MMGLLRTKNCLSCHFCAKRMCTDDGQEHVFSLRDNERADVRAANYDFLSKGNLWLVCGLEQWQEGVTGAPQRSQLAHKKCRYFFSYKDARGMTFSVARDEAEARRQDVQKVWNKVSVAAAIFSALGAIISAYFSYKSKAG
ncbi:hypothetical protein [Kordiimonas marina]|uniref:hypothetical protein n=1 Tax=Kordiimonas marina TaxID=2872312 RepID=UPI001FF5E3F7|nr:hypothetical protein [Kordiimonas marina]MCJ9427934.1 hypothetical protein [Kordiimonas marina]